MKANTSSMTAGGATMAPAIAAPMNGAVQGVATTTASKPVKKLPTWPPFIASDCPVPAIPPPTANTPDRLSPTPNSSQAVSTGGVRHVRS